MPEKENTGGMPRKGHAAGVVSCAHYESASMIFSMVR